MITVVTVIAELCHTLNKAICEANGDFSQVPWDEAPEWQKTSAINGVLFRLSHPESTPADQHKAWVDAKLADGWVRGDVKNVEKKQHPCLVPYVDLPIHERIKDHVFRAATDFLAKNMQVETPDAAVLAEDTVKGDVDTHPIEEGAPVEIGTDLVSPDVNASSPDPSAGQAEG